jgi:hypothetical protein
MSTMSWIFWLILAVIVTAIAGVTAIQPAGTRPIGHTHMMHAGRVVLVTIVALCAYAAYRAHAGI